MNHRLLSLFFGFTIAIICLADSTLLGEPSANSTDFHNNMAAISSGLDKIYHSCKSGSISGHDYVDLALPSGTLWATCNIGASKPEDYGLYFAWGETNGYKCNGKKFIWDNYKYGHSNGIGRPNVVTKYCQHDRYGKIDNKQDLDLQDDAAYINWGEPWEMPSQKQIEELLNWQNCSRRWVIYNGVLGCQIISQRNNNFIFLPAAGLGNGKYVGQAVAYWSKNLLYNGSEPIFPRDDESVCLYTELNSFQDKEKLNMFTYARPYGLSVRSVCIKGSQSNKRYTSTTNGNNSNSRMLTCKIYKPSNKKEGTLAFAYSPIRKSYCVTLQYQKTKFRKYVTNLKERGVNLYTLLLEDGYSIDVEKKGNIYTIKVCYSDKKIYETFYIDSSSNKNIELFQNDYLGAKRIENLPLSKFKIDHK